MITAVIPKLPFIEKQKTIDFYTLLGFTLGADYGDYLIMNSDHTELHFFSYPTLQPAKSDFMIYFRVTDVELLYPALQQRGIAIHPNGKLEVKPWKQKEFAVIDPNGTLLTFGQAVEE
jgi:uncharacterized glyoxalase superfamily protein PhnB